jgi:hypothetical protein
LYLAANRVEREEELKKFTSFKQIVSCYGENINNIIKILITFGTSQELVYFLFNSLYSIRYA